MYNATLHEGPAALNAAKIPICYAAGQALRLCDTRFDAIAWFAPARSPGNSRVFLGVGESGAIRGCIRQLSIID